MRYFLAALLAAFLVSASPATGSSLVVCENGTMSMWINEFARRGYKPTYITEKAKLQRVTAMYNSYPPETAWKPDTVLVFRIPGPRGVVVLVKKTCVIGRGLIPYRDLAAAMRPVGWRI